MNLPVKSAGETEVILEDVDSELLPGDCVRAIEPLAEAFDARSIRTALIGGLAFVD